MASFPHTFVLGMAAGWLCVQSRSLLGGQNPPEAAAQRWGSAERLVAEEGRRQVRKHRMLMTGCLVSLALMVALIVLAIALSSP